VTIRRYSFIAAFCLALSAPDARAGHVAPSYIDGGQSADGRFVVTAAVATGKQPYGPFTWKFTWKDTQTGATHTGDLKGVSTAGLYSHIFVSPDGATFVVWNPLIMHTNAGKGTHATEENKSDPAWRKEAFSRRLVIYSRTGELLKEFGVDDLLSAPEKEKAAIGTAFNRVHWLREYPGLSYRSVVRCGYALYQVSPDYTVLEFIPAFRKGEKEAAVRISLRDGHRLPPNEKLDAKQTPVRPFQGPAAVAEQKGAKEAYIPSLDPVRSAGKFPDGASSK
jgi:hypothetical protein